MTGTHERQPTDPSFSYPQPPLPAGLDLRTEVALRFQHLVGLFDQLEARGIELMEQPETEAEGRGMVETVHGFRRGFEEGRAMNQRDPEAATQYLIDHGHLNAE